jgi:hypothetical protein
MNKCIVCEAETNKKRKFCSIKCGSIYTNEKRRRDRKALLDTAIIYDRNKTVSLIKEYHKKSIISKNNITQSLYKVDVNLIPSIEYHTQYIKNRKFKEKYYHILNNLSCIPECRECGSLLDVNFVTIEQGYQSLLCKKCSQLELNKKTSDTHKTNKRTKNFELYKKTLSDEFIITTNKNDFIETGELSYIHRECGKAFSRKLAYHNGCPYCSKQGISKWEKEVNNFIESLDVATTCNKKLLKDETQQGNKGNREIDIYVPSYELGIECNGNYTHTENSGGKDRSYHLHKTEKSLELGVKLIHILESEWILKNEIVKSIISNKLHKSTNIIYARKCVIKEVSVNDKNEFLEQNHLQGKDNSKIRLGLCYNDKLVSIMTFGSRRITGKTTFELLRYCNILNTNVVGGASKLFKMFLNNFWDGQEIHTYADRRYSTGDLYDKLGFTLSHISPPNYWYCHKKDLYTIFHRSIFMKHKLEKRLDIFNPDTTEWDNMQVNGYDRIWDCGNYVFCYK